MYCMLNKETALKIEDKCINYAILKGGGCVYVLAFSFSVLDLARITSVVLVRKLFQKNVFSKKLLIEKSPQIIQNISFYKTYWLFTTS